MLPKFACVIMLPKFACTLGLLPAGFALVLEPLGHLAALLEVGPKGHPALRLYLVLDVSRARLRRVVTGILPKLVRGTLCRTTR